jgi:exodeoxyribonuclease V alpha subunit
LAASREQGHCYLTEPQINTGIIELIAINLGEQLNDYLGLMKQACWRRLKLAAFRCC